MQLSEVQLFYRKNLQLAPYNNAEIGLVVKLVAGPEEVADPAGLGEALATCWEQVQQFTHAQEDVARARYLDSLPDGGYLNGQRPPPRGGNGHRPRLVEVDRQVVGEPPRPAAQEPAEPPFPPAAQEPQEAPQEPASGPETGEEEQGGGEDTPPAEAQPAPAPAAPLANPPKDAADAKARFYARYGDELGGTMILHVRRYLNDADIQEPTTIDGWVQLAQRTRDEARRRAEKQAAARQALAEAETKAAAKAPAAPQRRSSGRATATTK